MNANITIILSVTGYKITCLIVGLIISYMGFKLFMAGILGGSSDMNLDFKGYKLFIKKTAPGTFFALFGTAVIGFTIYKGLELESSQNIKFLQKEDATSIEKSISNINDLPK